MSSVNNMGFWFFVNRVIKLSCCSGWPCLCKVSCTCWRSSDPLASRWSLWSHRPLTFVFARTSWVCDLQTCCITFMLIGCHVVPNIKQVDESELLECSDCCVFEGRMGYPLRASLTTSTCTCHGSILHWHDASHGVACVSAILSALSNKSMQSDARVNWS